MSEKINQDIDQINQAIADLSVAAVPIFQRMAQQINDTFTRVQPALDAAVREWTVRLDAIADTLNEIDVYHRDKHGMGWVEFCETADYLIGWDDFDE